MGLLVSNNVTRIETRVFGSRGRKENGGGATNASGFLPFLSMKEEVSNSVNGGYFFRGYFPLRGWYG
jgi:hypothetical protein